MLAAPNNKPPVPEEPGLLGGGYEPKSPPEGAGFYGGLAPLPPKRPPDAG